MYYENYIRPNSLDEDCARREYIFNILINGFILLTSGALVVSFISYIHEGQMEENIPPYIIVVPLVLLLAIYKLARRNFSNAIVYVFVGLYTLLATYGLYLYSFALSQGLLIYALVIIMSGILISSRAALILTSIILVTISLLAYFQINNILHPYTAGLAGPFGMEDVAIYLIIFFIIFTISWLSSKEIEASLTRARNSEKLLMAERSMLEIKIAQRTQELEKAQVEKTLELYRFAEFGRLTSSLLHDLSNPLTAVSLTFGQVETNGKSRAIVQVRDGITHMEQYIHSARRQLCSQEEKTTFSSKEIIEKVINFLAYKSHNNKVKLTNRLSVGAMLYGDSVKFSQVIANLIANAIDSYDETITGRSRKVSIVSELDIRNNLIILVQDNGKGISTGELTRIFEPFYTTKSSDRGTGIGLTITKRIVEEDFGGKIEAELTGEKGMTFTVTFPCKTISY